MLFVFIALAGWDKGKGKRGSEGRTQQRERQSHLRVEAVALTLSGGRRNVSVKFCPAAKWRHTAVSCPHSIHIHTFSYCCWLGAIGSGQQMPNTLSVLLRGREQRHATQQSSDRNCNKDQKRTSVIRAAMRLLCHYYYYYRTHLTKRKLRLKI